MAPSRPNQRLRDAMQRAGLSADALAERVGFDPKSVWRWVHDGVVPRRVGAKHQVADALGVAVDDIWPPEIAPPSNVDIEPATEELVAVWSHRADVQPAAWWSLLSGGNERIELLGYAIQFLPENHPRLNDLLASKASSRAKVRVALAHPDSRYVAERDAEERLDGTFRDRIRTTIDHLRPLFDVDGVQIATHESPMYCSMFRADDQLFYTPHLYGLKGYRAPLYHLRRCLDDGPFDALCAHFERIWATTTPLEPT